MNETVATILSIFCAVVGVLLLVAPVQKYMISLSQVGKFGGYLVAMGVILMTTFQWGEVALTAFGLKFEIRRAEQRIQELTNVLTEKDKAIAQLQEQTKPAVQTAKFDDLFQEWQRKGLVAAGATAGDFLSATNDLTIVPTPVINDMKVTPKPQIGPYMMPAPKEEKAVDPA